MSKKLDYTLDALVKNDVYRYRSELPPKDNYLLFQQAISFVNGVEFLKTESVNGKPTILLLNVPGLSIELKRTESILRDFNTQLLTHLRKYIDDSKELFHIFMHFYELYRSVLLQQNEYNDSREKFFATAGMARYPYKDLRNLKLPYIRSYYKSLFKDIFSGAPEPIFYHDIGTTGKKHLEQLYLFKRRYNIALIKDLDKMKKLLFKPDKKLHFYKYEGNTSDILEIALALLYSEKLTRLDNKQITATEFSKDLAGFLGRSFSSISSDKIKAEKEISQMASFLHQSIKRFRSK